VKTPLIPPLEGDQGGGSCELIIFLPLLPKLLLGKGEREIIFLHSQAGAWE